MANNDVQVKDNNTPYLVFYPETIDLGSSVRRPMYGSADGAFVTLGAKADATWDGSSASSAMSIFRWIGTKLEAIRALVAGTLNVAGTVSVSNLPATQPVSIATMPNTPVTGTFWPATQPVSAASLPLPTGAATVAKQPALGTAGSPSSDVLTVQGAASMTPFTTADLNGAAFNNAVTMTAGGTGIAAGRSVEVNCTISGNVSLQLSGGSAHIVPVQVGYQTLPFSVTTINTSGTTATATYSNLY